MDQVRFVFIDCQGFGLMIGKSLAKIKPPLLMREGLEDTFYLVDDDGAIRCILLQTQDLYVSDSNVDRRLQNTQNGFEVSWEANGELCVVRHMDSACVTKRPPYRRLIGLIASFLIGLVFGLVIGLSDDEPVPPPPPVDSSTSNTTSDEKAQAQAKAQADSLLRLKELAREQTEAVAVEQAKADSIHKANIRAEAGRYKQKLWDINCSKRTVDEVEGWWNKLSNEDQEIIRGIYDFKKGIALYKAFFQATRKEDLTVIITIKNQRYIHKYCFSDDQWIVIILGYAKDSETFKKYKSVFGEVRFGRDVLNVAKQKNNENSN